MMENAIYYAGILALLWMGTGLLAFVVGSVSDAYSGKTTDGEWPLVLAICIGAGPYIFILMFACMFEDWRRGRYEKARKHR